MGVKSIMRLFTTNSSIEKELQESSSRSDRSDVVESIEDGKSKMSSCQGDKAWNPHRSQVEDRCNQSTATDSCPQKPPPYNERRPSRPNDAAAHAVPRLDAPESESDHQSYKHHSSPKPLETASKAMGASVPHSSTRDAPPPETSSADRPVPGESPKTRGLDDDGFKLVVNRRNGGQSASSNSNPTNPEHLCNPSNSKKHETDYHTRYLKVRGELQVAEQYLSKLKYMYGGLNYQYQALSQDHQAILRNNQVLEEKVRELQARNEKLEVAHIKSVNSVGTGVEPVSDQEFIKRFGDLQMAVNSFFRRMSRGKEIKCDPLKTFPWLSDFSRCYRSPSECGLKVGHTLEMLLWTYLERAHVERVAIPDNNNALAHVRDTEALVSRADSSKQKYRTEFWRSYTMSMVTQGDAWEQFYTQGLFTQTQIIVENLGILIGQTLSKHETGEIYEFVKTFFEISTDISRQRSWYEFDTFTAPGSRFHPDSMEDFKNLAEDDDSGPLCQWVVEAVVSRGLVRKKHRRTGDIEKQVIKARVTLGRERPTYMFVSFKVMFKFYPKGGDGPPSTVRVHPRCTDSTKHSRKMEKTRIDKNGAQRTPPSQPKATVSIAPGLLNPRYHEVATTLQGVQPPHGSSTIFDRSPVPIISPKTKETLLRKFSQLSILVHVEWGDVLRRHGM
ncbi:hypothetical protein EX30DRAFT_348394 [Ascodesmis nigricans]|uniref:Uncharacterized protein n=1 Tax=Ascodesmis nigricans TaxID=341454 RepID=A0A4S2MXV3_9PEZI|nr:hypothetical protein EX30DRAFT_348394 [Ascodesmis nigricans]